MRHRSCVVGIATILSAGLLPLVAVGCAEHDPQQNRSVPSCTAPVFPAPYTAVDPCSADAVLTSAARVMFTYQPDRQPDCAATFLTAGPLIEPDYLHRIGASAAALMPITVATWEEWASRHIGVTATVRITADDHSADTGTRARRVIAVTQHPDNEPPNAFTAYMQATRTGTHNPWLVTDMEIK